MKQFDILTIFPEMFSAKGGSASGGDSSYFSQSIIKRAIASKKIAIKIHNFRKFANDKHNTVDDRPYGGGPGMILKFEPIAKALRALTINKKQLTVNSQKKTRIIMLTPAGKQFDQAAAKRLSKYNQIVLLCGRYEGFDARIEKLVDEKISIGPYVLSGGELPAMIVTEAIARNVKGVLGHKDATKEETFSSPDYIEYPQYTRPEIVEASIKGKKKSLRVPKALLTGNHAEIAKWRSTKSKKR